MEGFEYNSLELYTRENTCHLWKKIIPIGRCCSIRLSIEYPEIQYRGKEGQLSFKLVSDGTISNSICHGRELANAIIVKKSASPLKKYYRLGTDNYGRDILSQA
jgi:ABC-type dipeptide/oligopeptide/nickel transport system permease subunit